MRRMNASGSSQKGRWPLCSNTAISDPGIALWIAQATDGAVRLQRRPVATRVGNLKPARSGFMSKRCRSLQTALFTFGW